jgi:hypothetical protein
LASDQQIPPEVRDCAVVRLRDLYARTARRRSEAACSLASSAVRSRRGKPATSDRDPLRWWPRIGETERALEIMERAIETHSEDVELLSDVVAGTPSHDRAALASALARLVDSRADPRSRHAGASWRHCSKNWRGAARSPWAELLPIRATRMRSRRWSATRKTAAILTPPFRCFRAGSALSRVEDVAGGRVAQPCSSSGSTRDEARAELESLLAATGDALSVPARARRRDAVGDSLRAAPLWLRASAITSDRREAADLARRGLRGSLRKVAMSVPLGECSREWKPGHSGKTVRAQVEVERRGEDPRSLAVALDELALAQEADPSTARAPGRDRAAYHAAGDIDSARSCPARCRASRPTPLKRSSARVHSSTSCGAPAAREEARVTGYRAAADPAQA